MAKFVFWNLKQGSAIPYLGALCAEQSPDILIIAEASATSDAITSAINAPGSPHQYVENFPLLSNIRFFNKENSGQIHLISDIGKRVSLRQFVAPSGASLIVAAAHIPSKLFAGDIKQLLIAEKIKSAIEDAENNIGTTKSIIIGDLNMNPFDIGVTSPSGLHGVMSKHEAGKYSKTYDGTRYSMFYNPMWGIMGNDSTGPAGTHYYDNSDIPNYYWNTFDQILIRPSLIDHFDNNKLQVLTQIGTVSLLSNNKINSSISDHLPISVEISI